MKPKKPSKPSANSEFAGTEIEHIEHLLNFMTEHNLEEFEYSRGDLKIRLKKPSVNAVVGVRQPAAPEIIIPAAAQCCCRDSSQQAIRDWAAERC